MKFLIEKLFSFLVIFYPPRLNALFSSLKQRLYTAWIKRQLGQVRGKIAINKGLTLVGGKYISIGENVYIAKNCILTAWDKYLGRDFTPKIEIGSNVSLGEYNHITAINEVKIGNGVLTGRWVTVTDNAHGDIDMNSLKLKPSDRPLVTKGPVVIGDRVWIGDKVTILPGVTVGEGSVIGANAVVTKDIPPYCIAGGNPAKIIKQINGTV